MLHHHYVDVRSAIFVIMADFDNGDDDDVAGDRLDIAGITLKRP